MKQLYFDEFVPGYPLQPELSTSPSMRDVPSIRYRCITVRTVGVCEDVCVTDTHTVNSP
jgi:hypothetical protein